MSDQSPSVTRTPAGRLLFLLLALAVSVAVAAVSTFLKVSFFSLGWLASLALYGTLAWLFGRYERAVWWIVAPLLLLGQALFAWTALPVQGEGAVGRLKYARVLLVDLLFAWTPWKLILLLGALAGSWLGARSRLSAVR